MERAAIRYLRLFEVRLLHHYWLDDGGAAFDTMESRKKDRRLAAYDVRPFLKIAPTPATERNLSALHCLFRATSLGCVVIARGQSVVPQDTVLEFVLTAADPAFLDYTALTLRPQPIREARDADSGSVHRYKENAFVFSNLTGAMRGPANARSLYLSQEFPARGDPEEDPESIESLVVQDGALLQFTSDGPNASAQQLGQDADEMPVYVHQDDAPRITSPRFEGAPERGVLLSGDIPDNVFAVIRLSAAGSADGVFDFADAAGKPKSPHPVYQIRFKNRSTIRKYISKQTGVVASTAPSPLPLTFFGNAGSKRKPTDGLVRPVRAGTRITGLVSEIYE